MLYKHPEYPQAGFLRQGVKGNKGFLYVHMSRIVDIYNIVNQQHNRGQLRRYERDKGKWCR